MVNRWWAHTPKADETDGDGSGHHDRVAEDRLAREDRNDLGDDRKGREHQDIDLGMAEDPEEVHPDDSRAAGLGIEEVPPQEAVDQQHDLRRGQGRDGNDHQTGHYQHHPGQKRHATQGHAGTTHTKDGGNDIECRPDAAEAGDQQADDPIVGAIPN